MDKFVAVVVAVLVSPLVFAFAVAALAFGQPPFGGEASEEARGDIPAELLALYVAAAETCAGLPWAVVAAVAKVETNHGRFGDAQLLPDGDVEPRIIGVALDGTGGTRAIRDTDGGLWDGDPVWDRAVGPMQFIPSTWRAYGVDATSDGVADPHNFYDAVYSAVRYLCANGAGDPATLRRAILAYNQAGWYADRVLQVAVRYAPGSGFEQGVVGGYALPVARELLTLPLIRRAHHSYPAWDIALPEGTPVYAAHGGTVTAVMNGGRCGVGVLIAGHDGARYTYCHASAVTVTPGQTVAAGQPIVLSGNTGRSTGPHLHFQITLPSGALVCPQPLLESWFAGVVAVPSIAPNTACTA